MHDNHRNSEHTLPYYSTYLDKLDNIFHWELIAQDMILPYISFLHNELDHPKKRWVITFLKY